MIEPRGRGAFEEQAQEVLAQMREILQKQPQPMVLILATVFLREAGDQPACEKILAEFHGGKPSVMNFVLQPPCSGAALAIEAWAIGGKSVWVERHGPDGLSVSYDGVRWIYCAGIQPEAAGDSKVYPAVTSALERTKGALHRAGSRFEHVVRLWFYLGDVTGPEGELQRYHELNRARTDFYRDIDFGGSFLARTDHRGVYPASTGIGMGGRGLIVSCLALETNRKDLLLAPLENPRQTPPYIYPPRYSPQSPKFARAIAMILSDYATIWISGTASVVNSESRYPGDVEKQTEQTIDNIERLIASENFLRHGVKGAGASLQDLAKIRVYLRHQEDFARCRAICERRIGPVPAIYAVADVCRPELLVEIEGVAFSRCAPG
jgi:enamine deaminase RidA (YjgF/YER057c/UK114 family)